MAALPQAYTRHKADWRLLAEPLVAQGSPDDVMVVGSRDARDWQARTNWLCLRYYAPQPQMPVAFLSEPAPDVLRQMHGRDVWLYGGGQSMPLELLPGWQWTERQYVPHAGTLTRLRAAEKVEDASTP